MLEFPASVKKILFFIFGNFIWCYEQCIDVTVGWGTQTVLIVLCPCIYCFDFSMNDDEALRGADDAPVMAVADHIQSLKHRLAQLTQMVQTEVKLVTVGIEERRSVKMP